MSGIDCVEVAFSGHALQRMFQRAISPEEARAVLDEGEMLEDYPDDHPHPSRLLLGWVGHRALHVVVGRDAATRKCYVITVYPPDPARWDAEFRRRRR